MRNADRNSVEGGRGRAVALAVFAAGTLAVLVALVIQLDRADRPAGAERGLTRGAPRAATSTEQRDRAADEGSVPGRSAAIEGVVLDGDGAAVAAATVILHDRAGTTSDAEGRFRFEGLAAGSYDLHAHATSSAAGPLPVRVLEDQTTEVIVRLYPGVAMEVEVVSVVDGAPLPRARGSLYIGNTLGDAGRVDAVADERGILRFPVVSLTTYVIAAEADGFAPSTRLLTWNDRPGLAWRIRVALEPGVEITGRVVDERGAPVAGAQVTSRAPRRDSTVSPYRPRLPDRDRPPVVSDRDGRFRYPVPRGQSLILTARHPTWSDGESARLVADAAQEVTITLRAGLEIRGRVVDEHGVPVAGATVRDVGSSRVEERTGVDGAFIMRGIDRRRRQLVLRAEVAGATSSALSLALPGGAERTVELALEHRLALRGAVTRADGTPAVDAVVAYRRTRPPGQAAARPSAPGSPSASPGNAPAIAVVEAVIQGETRAGADGAFAIDGLAAGTYELLARVPASAAGRIARPLMAFATASAGDERVSLVLPAPARITGRIVDAAGRPVGEATISLGEIRGDTELRAADGRFELAEIDPGLGRLTLHIAAAGAAELAIPVDVVPGETTDLGTLRLPPGRRLSGRVLETSTGGPVAGAAVAIDAVDGTRIALVRADELGAWTAAVPVGPLVVHAAYRGVGGSRFVTVTANQDRVDLRLPETAHLEVEVVTGTSDVDVTALAVSAQRLDRPDGGLRVWLLDRIAGQPVFRAAVSPGTYRVQLGPPGKPALERNRGSVIEVTLAPDQHHRVTISAEATASTP